MKLGPTSNLRGIHFEEHEWHQMPLIAVAGLERPPEGWQGWDRKRWFAWATWQAAVGEQRDVFKARITRHLQADNMAAMRGTAERPGVAASSIEGELVFIYFGAAYWVRSMMRPAHAHGLATA
jgi:hypothetical protein